MMCKKYYHYLRRVGGSLRMTNTQLTGKTRKKQETISKSLGQLINGCKCKKAVVP